MMRNNPFSPGRGVIVALLIALPAVLVADAAAQSPQIAELNEVYARIPEVDRADLVLLPAAARMDPPPASVSTIAAAALLAPGDRGWSDAVAWATAPRQQEALDALREVTERQSRYVFAQLYGDAAGREAIENGAWVGYGDPPLLIAPRFHYFDALTNLAMLAQVEATRLAEAGDGPDAVELVIRFLRLGRLLADREYFQEKKLGFQWMRFALERTRDIVYSHPDALDDVESRAVIRNLADRSINIDRIRLPRANRLGAQELLQRTFIERGGPNPDTFGATLAQMGAVDRPLRLFAESARWQRVAENHADYFATRDQISAIFDDWSLRWPLGPYDTIRQSPTDYERTDPARFAMIMTAVPDFNELFDQRLMLRTELRGARMALAIHGYKQWTGSWPDPIFAVRPRFVTEIEIDPWDPDQQAIYGFFIPMRDQPVDERTEPQPHVMQIIGAGDAPEAPAGPSRDEIASWLRTSPAAASIPQNVTPRAVRQVVDSTPANVPDHMKDQFRNQIVQGLRMGGSEIPEPLPGWILTLANADDADSRSGEEIYVDAMIKINFSESYRRGLLELSEQPSVTPDEIVNVMAETVLDLLRLGGGAPAGFSGDGETLYPIPTFSVTLTDDDFVLYSMGLNHQPDRAQRVGPGGDDFLIWPPMLSLVRERLSQ